MRRHESQYNSLGLLLLFVVHFIALLLLLLASHDSDSTRQTLGRLGKHFSFFIRCRDEDKNLWNSIGARKLDLVNLKRFGV